jgi:hypothetical protein
MMGANIVVGREERCQLMVEVGDRIRLSSMKGAGREGLVTAVAGSLVRVRWLSGEETMVAPAPGTLSVLAAAKAVPQKGAKKKGAARNTAGASKKDIASKSAPPKKSGARKIKRS